jgi:hypothetical protein
MARSDEENEEAMTELTTKITYHVVAYNESWGGYGDNASRDFTSQEEAVEYARKLPPHLIEGASIWKETKVSGSERVKIEF